MNDAIVGWGTTSTTFEKHQFEVIAGWLKQYRHRPISDTLEMVKSHRDKFPGWDDETILLVIESIWFHLHPLPEGPDSNYSDMCDNWNIT